MRLSNLPWWAKVIVKAALSAGPFSYEQIRGCLTGYHGEMVSENYAKGVFAKFMRDYQEFSSGSYRGAHLELGPGGSVLSGLLARIAGFEKSFLIDVDDFATRDFNVYRSTINRLEERDRAVFNAAFAECGDVIEACREIGVLYLTEGLASLSQIPSHFVSFSFSNAVLEHVRYCDFARFVAELRRIHRSNAVSAHQIDYKDHLGGSLNHLRFSQGLWESRYFPNSAFYTNRLRHCDILKTFAENGFRVVKNDTVSWDSLPLHREEMAREFCDYSEEQLLISGAHIALIL